MKKKELMEILEQYPDDTDIRVQFMDSLEEIDKGDCFEITDMDGTEKSIYLQIW